jgi:hypothetical protein
MDQKRDRWVRASGISSQGLLGGSSSSKRSARSGLGATGVSRGIGLKYLAFCAPVHLGTQRETGALLITTQPRQEHDALGEYERRGDGDVRGGSGQYDPQRILILCRSGSLAHPPPWVALGQVVVLDNLVGAHLGERVRELIEGRGCELSTYHPLPTTLLAGPQPDRGGLRQAQSAVAESSGQRSLGSG